MHMDMPGLTQDRFLDGRLVVAQTRTGFRSGLDAVMLAAAVPAREAESVLELGSGAGAASLCLAARIPGCAILGVERDAVLVDLARRNAALNNMKENVYFSAGDVLALPGELRREFSHVFANPPFHDEDGEIPADAARAAALHDEGRLGDWLRTGLKRTASSGTFTFILRTDRLAEALAALPARGIEIFPLWPKAGEPSKRVVIRLTKGARRPLALLAGLVLHDANGRYTAQADAVLRDAVPLNFSPRNPGAHR